MPKAPLLPTYYYHENFLKLVQHVNTLYRDLLTMAELNFIDTFLSLPDNAQQLYVRLLCRKGDIFRFEKLNYPEIPEIVSAAAALIQARFGWWLDDDSNHQFAKPEILQRFTKPELLSLSLQCVPDAAQAKLQRYNREELEQYCVDNWLPLKSALLSHRLFAIAGEQCFQTLRLLYFGNLHQDFTDFVLRDLGVHRYERYRISPDCRGFRSRQQLDAYLDYYHLQQMFEQLKAFDTEALLNLDRSLKNLLSQSQVLADPRLERKLDHRRVEVARQLERINQPDQALMIYVECKVEPARERRCRILFKTKRFCDCVQLCCDIWLDCYSETERQFVLTFVPRLIKQLKTSKGQPSANLRQLLATCESIQQHHIVLREYRLTASREGIWDEQGVEAAALHTLTEFKTSQGCPGYGLYVENSLVLSVFGLFFWPVIFAQVQGAFFHDFQYRPDDLYDVDFLQRRLVFFEEKQKTIKNENGKTQFIAEINQRIDDKFGISNPFVFWGMMDDAYLELLNRALIVIPMRHWRAMFDYIWRDIRAHRSGLPDLIWLSDSGRYELVEVKGPGDSLQKNQLGWLEYFSQHNIPAAVLYLADD